MFSMSFIFVLFMLHLLTVCALYVCLCEYVNICMYLVLLHVRIFGKKLLRACVYCYTKTEFKKVFLFLSYLIKCKNNIHKAEDLKLNTFLLNL